jgi:hypothetical protein
MSQDHNHLNHATWEASTTSCSRRSLPVSDNILAAAAADPQVARLDHPLAHFFAGSSLRLSSSTKRWERARRFTFWLWLYSLSRIGATAHASLPPDGYARRTVRVPDALLWLYPLLRPVGWVLRPHEVEIMVFDIPKLLHALQKRANEHGGTGLCAQT